MQAHLVALDAAGRITAASTSDYRVPPERWLVSVWRDEDDNALHVAIRVPGEPVSLSIDDYDTLLQPGQPYGGPGRPYDGQLMDRAAFLALCRLFMASDPSPLPRAEDQRLRAALDREAVHQGFESWIEAFHAAADDEHETVPETVPDTDSTDGSRRFRLLVGDEALVIDTAGPDLAAVARCPTRHIAGVVCEALERLQPDMTEPF
jgi:hypothetical protein